MTEDAEEQDELPDDEAVPEDVGEAEFEELAEENPAAAFEQAGGAPGTHLQAAEYWDEIIADMEATAEEYEADGWETIQLHSGDVTVLVPDERDERFGLDVLVPNDEFAAVEDLLEDGVTFESYEVFQAMVDELMLFVVAMEDADAEVAVLYPAYYDAENAQEMLEAAESAGEMRTYVRTLTKEQIEFTHDEPSNFAPPEESEGAGAGDGEEEA